MLKKLSEHSLSAWNLYSGRSSDNAEQSTLDHLPLAGLMQGTLLWLICSLAQEMSPIAPVGQTVLALIAIFALHTFAGCNILFRNSRILAEFIPHRFPNQPLTTDHLQLILPAAKFFLFAYLIYTKQAWWLIPVNLCAATALSLMNSASDHRNFLLMSCALLLLVFVLLSGKMLAPVFALVLIFFVCLRFIPSLELGRGEIAAGLATEIIELGVLLCGLMFVIQQG